MKEEGARLLGSGAYAKRQERIILLTCEHVVRGESVRSRFYGSDEYIESACAWTADRYPVDAAFRPIESTVWDQHAAQADAIAWERFALQHAPVAQEELLFFRGYAGENARYGFGVHQTNASGYCTQEKVDAGDDQIFELFWEPLETQFTSETPDRVRSDTRYDNAEGFSGSLVWNTRYLEVTQAGGVWTPRDAVVTGLLRNWDQKTKTLLAWRAEHLRAWLDRKSA